MELFTWSLQLSVGIDIISLRWRLKGNNLSTRSVRKRGREKYTFTNIERIFSVTHIYVAWLVAQSCLLHVRKKESASIINGCTVLYFEPHHSSRMNIQLHAYDLQSFCHIKKPAAMKQISICRPRLVSEPN